MFRVTEDNAELCLECVVGGFVLSPAYSCRGFGELGFEDMAVVAAAKTYRLLGIRMCWMRRTADHAWVSWSGEAAVAEIRFGASGGAVDSPDFAAPTAAALGPGVAAFADRAVVGVGVCGRVLPAPDAGAVRSAVAIRTQCGAVAPPRLDRQHSPTLSAWPPLAGDA